MMLPLLEFALRIITLRIIAMLQITNYIVYVTTYRASYCNFTCPYKHLPPFGAPSDHRHPVAITLHSIYLNVIFIKAGNCLFKIFVL